MVTDVKMVKYLQYVVLTLSSFLLAGCGYNVAARYELSPSVSYHLLVTTDNQQEASSTLLQAFKDEGLEPILAAKYSGVESYFISHSSSHISFTISYSSTSRNVVIRILPSRMLSRSNERENEHEKRKASLLRIKDRLEKSDVFDEYISTEAQGLSGKPTGIPPKPKENPE